MIRWFLVLLAFLYTNMFNNAWAQDFTFDQQPVIERSHQGYHAPGLQYGVFKIQPRFDIGVSYNDNIYATPQKESDWITSLRPQIAIKTEQKSFYDVALNLSANQAIYKDNRSENYTDYTIDLASRIYANKSLWFDSDFVFEHLHEDRNDPNAVQITTQPLTYDRHHASLIGYYQYRKTRLGLGASWQQYRFDNSTSPAAMPVIQNDRDRNEYGIHGEVVYEMSPHYEAFVEASINQINYQRNDFVSGSNTYSGDNRDSTGYEILSGMRFDITSLVRADIGLGYLAQNYSQTGLTDINGLNLQAKFLWNVTPLTDLTLQLNRNVQETVSAGSSGYIETALQGVVDHELKRHIILSTGFDYAVQDYQGISQNDKRTNFFARGTYKMNQNLAWVLEYIYDKRDSNQTGLDFDRNIIMLRAVIKR